jgi:C1A family cysteine protease
MKKIFPLLCIIFLSGYNSYGQNFVPVSKINSPSSVTIATDQVLEVRLPSTPSTGFGWYLKNGDQNIVVQTGEEDFISDDLNNPIGNSGTQIMRYIGTNRGVKELEFVYKRPWEDEDPLADSYKITVVSEGVYNGKPIMTETKETNQSSENTSYSVYGLPASFSWEALGKCTPCKNQAQCGSCWTFAACGSFESVIKIVDGAERDMAEQWLVNCDSRFNGCAGGMCPNAMFKNGTVYEVDQPYMAKDGTCKSSLPHHEKIKGTYSAGNSVASIKQAIYNYGPVWAAVFVGQNFRDYKPGTVLTKSDGTSINHAIVLVGWDDATNSWVLRNSWGTTWGEHEGYMRIKYGISAVGSYAEYIDYKGIVPHTPTVIDANTQNNAITLSPNPNNGIFTIEGLENQNNLEIYDVVGKMLYKTIATGNSAAINLSSNEKGIYFYKITDLSSNNIKQGKLIIN